MKGWKPTIAEDGAPRKFQASIGELLPSVGPCLEDLEEILHAAVVVPGNRVEVHDRRRPWENDELRDLILKRKESTTQNERRIVSKQIQKLSRKLLRQHNDAKITSILTDFAWKIISGLSKPSCTNRNYSTSRTESIYEVIGEGLRKY